jgi:hypothetical protein
MPDSADRSDALEIDNPPENQRGSATQVKTQQEDDSQERITASDREETLDVPRGRGIWTPGFILAFVLVLVLGVSAESVISQAWANGVIASPVWFLEAHIILLALGWLVLGIVTCSTWIRTGSVFGIIGAGFMMFDIIMVRQNINAGSPLQSSINAATCVALLGAYVGLSVEGTLLTGWDSWLFLLTPALSAIGVGLVYRFTPQPNLMTIENAVATAALISCTLFWWGRPSCWRKQPGPTLLFGLIPVFLFCVALADSSMHSFFLLQVTSSFISPDQNVNNAFFAQMALLGLFLGCMRLSKGEIQN